MIDPALEKILKSPRPELCPECVDAGRCRLSTELAKHLDRLFGSFMGLSPMADASPELAQRHQQIRESWEAFRRYREYADRNRICDWEPPPKATSNRLKRDSAPGSRKPSRGKSSKRKTKPKRPGGRK